MTEVAIDARGHYESRHRRQTEGRRQAQNPTCPHGWSPELTAPPAILMMRAGTPAAVACGGSDRLTTAPAPMMQLRPMVTPSRILAPAPIHTLSSMCIPLRVVPERCKGNASVPGL